MSILTIIIATKTQRIIFGFESMILDFATLFAAIDLQLFSKGL